MPMPRTPNDGDAPAGEAPPPSSPSSPPRSPSSAPFHARSSTARGGAGRGAGAGGAGAGTVLFVPSTYQITCRGALVAAASDRSGKTTDGKYDASDRNGGTSDGKGNTASAGAIAVGGKDEEEALKAQVEEDYVCKGIWSRLRHVSDHPFATTQENAIRWFVGNEAQRLGAVAPKGHGDGKGVDDKAGSNNNKPENDNNNSSNSSSSSSSSTPGNGNKGSEKGGLSVGAMGSDDNFASYGTTQLNLLALRPVQVELPPGPPRSSFEDAFAGFGALPSNRGATNPFGSMFGGFFGGMDPWSHIGEAAPEADNGEQGQPGFPGFPSSGMPGGWTQGSQSMSSSSSTRTERDNDGRRIMTTVTTTTTVDREGNKKTETVTTRRHLDDGGRVETEKQVQRWGDDATAKKADGEGKEEDEKRNQLADAPRWPASPLAGAAMPAPGPVPARAMGPPRVTAVSPKCLLGVTVTETAANDPEGSGSPSKGRGKDGKKDAAGWRQKDIMIWLGKIGAIQVHMNVPPPSEQKQHREEKQRECEEEFNDMRDRHWKGLWDKKDVDEKKNSLPSLANRGGAELSEELSWIEYMGKRLYVQMGKNLEMMGSLMGIMARPDFPPKMLAIGTRILQNVGPTAEKMGVFARDNAQEAWRRWGSGRDGEGGGAADGGRGR